MGPKREEAEYESRREEGRRRGGKGRKESRSSPRTGPRPASSIPMTQRSFSFPLPLPASKLPPGVLEKAAVSVEAEGEEAEGGREGASSFDELVDASAP